MAGLDVAVDSAVAGVGTANVTVASGSVLLANPTRLGSQIVNDSDTTVYLALGVAAQANKGIRLNANGGCWDGKVGGVVWRGAVNSIHSGTGTKVLVYLEV